jgi:hypothetical protein
MLRTAPPWKRNVHLLRRFDRVLEVFAGLANHEAPCALAMLLGVEPKLSKRRKALSSAACAAINDDVEWRLEERNLWAGLGLEANDHPLGLGHR